MTSAATILSEGSFHPSLRQGATQTGVEEVTKRFKKYVPYVFSSHMNDKPDIEKAGNVNQYRININFFDRLMGHSYLYQVAQRIKKLRIPIVHVRNRPLYMPTLRKLLGPGVKLVLHEHNQNIADTLTRKQAISVLDSIDAYVAVSRFTYDFEITNRYPEYKQKSRVILNGVNLKKFLPYWEQKNKRAALRGKYGIEGSRNVLFAGAIRERKGVHTLVEAFKKVVAQMPDAKLIIAGGSKDNTEANDPYAKKVIRSASEIKDNVVFLGYVPPTNVQDIYMLGDIFVGPSQWDEAFGLVFAEASASGLAVIGSRRGGIPEIIQDGRTGLLINDPQDKKEIAQKVISLLESPVKCQEMGKAARKRMEDMFSWDRVAKEIEGLYDELLK